MVAYATRADVYKYGFSRGTLGNPGRLVASALASTNVLTLEGHGFETDDEILLRAESGGSLPSPLVAGTAYYAIRLTDSTFSVATTPGGTAVNLTTDGESVVVSAALPFDEVLEFYSRFVDDFLPAHLVPLAEPYPVTVTATVAELAAKKLQLIAGQTSDAIDAVELAAKARLERWAKGLRIRDPKAATSANLALARSGNGNRGWDGVDPTRIP